ncbi:uncharacterized protein LOC113285774 [Papaver somniferum]|uniref:uncharacterized protein LOC113285774 n=1 Tax=Papaver somniferum TaxID=3469 RepID=UPI000E703CAA|nr:uncharacterized protein LOC113285774 [Papaver somniferum]
MKKYVDSHRTERSYEINDLVYLRLQPYRQTTVASTSFSKLSPRFYGPFRVLEKIGSVAYKLELPATSRIHPVFHVSQLKRRLRMNVHVVAVLPDVIDYDKWEPSAILQRRIYKNRAAKEPVKKTYTGLEPEIPDRNRTGTGVTGTGTGTGDSEPS